MHARSKRVFAVAGIALGITVLEMIWTLVNTALASIQKDLFASVLQLQWMMNCYGIFACVPLLTMGRLGDAYGRKKLFLYGLGVALLAAGIGGFATRIELLIACMGLLGLSASMILPLSQALLVHQFPERQKGKAVAIWVTFSSLSISCGPIVSGLILNWLSWKWIYWVNIPVILTAIIAIYFFVEKDKEFHKRHSDWTGISLLALIVGSLVMGIMQGPAWGWESPLIIGLFVLCLISLALFIYLENKTKMPLFCSELFSNRSFLFSAIPTGCIIGFIWVALFIIPLYLQNKLHFSALATGFFLLLLTLPLFFLSVPVSKWVHKFGVKPILLTGYGFFLIAFLLQGLFTPNYWTLTLGTLAIGLGWPLTWGPSMSNAFSSVPHQIAGTASGMFATLQEVGAVVSLALAGVFFRAAQMKVLEPHMDLIDSSLHDGMKLESLLSNPAAVEQLLGQDAPVALWLESAFSAGFEASFQFLLGSCIVAILITSLLPKKHG